VTLAEVFSERSKKETCMKQTSGYTRFFFPSITTFIILMLLAITFLNWRNTSKRDIGHYIAQDISRLATIFEDINNTAGILGFDRQKNEINFLNIKKEGFVGSELGSMNLMYPRKWQGPYEKEMPRIQEEDYMIVRTKNGYFITPGEGVQLPNGMVIGEDIILDENADIEHMMHDESLLSYDGKPLAAKISVHGPMPQPQVIFPENGD
jgi:hypothetical protein